MNVNITASREWFAKGDEDLGASRALFEKGYYNAVGFHSQQAAEKYIKGYVVLNGLKFEKRHNLETLLKICSKHDKDFNDFINSARILDNYYIPTRYPMPWADIDKKRAREAIRLAEGIAVFIKRISKI